MSFALPLNNSLDAVRRRSYEEDEALKSNRVEHADLNHHRYWYLLLILAFLIISGGGGGEEKK